MKHKGREDHAEIMVLDQEEIWKGQRLQRVLRDLQAL